MRPIMARLRGPRLTPGERVAVAVAPFTDRRLGYADALTEGMQVAERLGLEVLAPMDAGDLVRFVYAQGWQAAEKRMGASDMADQIDLAMRTPAEVLEQRPGETPHGHQVRAVQQVVAYGMAQR